MDKVNKQELRRLAEAATPGRVYDRLPEAGGGIKYHCFGDDGSVVLQVDHKNGEFGFIGPRGEQDEAFFLACKPAAILSLLSELDSLHGAMDSPDEITAVPADDYDTLRKQFMSLMAMANSKCRQVKHWRAQSSYIQQQEIWKNAANVNAERDTNAMLTDCLERAEAELEQYRKDAQRYRWLCDGNGYFMEEQMLCHVGNEKAKADAAIDEAIAEEGGANG